jgi:serpin B
MTANRLTIAVSAAMLITGCGESITEPDPITELPRALTLAEREVIAASNEFAFGLLSQVNGEQPGENIFLSPLSASMALGMTMNGARGETFDAMRGTLGFGDLSQPEINESYRGLIDLLLGLDPRVELAIANSIWYRDTYSFEQPFFDATSTYFDAEVAGLNFADPASLDRINSWVDDKTNGKIDKILNEIKPDDVMYLINAIYFKGDWTTQFDKADTRDAPFYGSSGEEVVSTVKMMRRDGGFDMYRGDGFRVADLSYGGGAFSMTVILPDRDVDVNDVVEALDTQRWAEMTAGFTKTEMDLHLPRFRLEYEKSFVDALTALGMGIAFGPGQDFTGMSSANPFISNVVQKTFVDVNEEGTTAAAVTVVTMTVTSAPPAFIVDRPFIFAIRERLSGAILFIGKMMVPESPA